MSSLLNTSWVTYSTRVLLFITLAIDIGHQLSVKLNSIALVMVNVDCYITVSTNKPSTSSWSFFSFFLSVYLFFLFSVYLYSPSPTTQMSLHVLQNCFLLFFFFQPLDLLFNFILFHSSSVLNHQTPSLPRLERNNSATRELTLTLWYMKWSEKKATTKNDNLNINLI